MKRILTLMPLLWLMGCGGGSKDVRISVALPPKLDLTRYEYLYMPGFIVAAESEKIDAERETMNFLKREFLRRTNMGVVNYAPVDLSEKDPRSFFLPEQPFFRSMNFPNVESTLALTGVLSFEAVDRSGFREVERTDQTGRRITQAQYVEITGFNLEIRVYVYDLGNGKLLYTDVMTDTADVEGSNVDERLVLYDLMERVSVRVLGLFSNTLVRAERSLL